MRIALHAQMDHRLRLPGVPPLTDEQLRSITAPAVVVVAGRSAPFDAKVAAERAQLIASVDVDVVAGARHEISWTHLDRCLDHVTHATL
jgi:pimeloyl-ACP methyl ester carboxylesterase